MIILVTLTIPLLTMLRQSTDYLTTQIDYRIAQNRIFSALSLIRHPVFYCGMGMPVDTEEYRVAFGRSRFQPFNWAGPVSAVKNSLGKENGELRIVYAKSEHIKLKENFEYIKQGKTISFTKNINENSIIPRNSGIPENTRNCIIFKSSFPVFNPLIVRSANKNSPHVVVESFINPNFFKLYKNDTMYVLCAMKVFCKSGVLYTNDFKIAGDQPRVDGVNDIRFNVNKDKQNITIYLLVRGNQKFDTFKEIIGIEQCPTELAEEWTCKKSNYQRYAVKTVWRLPNCLSKNFFSKIEVEEQY